MLTKKNKSVLAAAAVGVAALALTACSPGATAADDVEVVTIWTIQPPNEAAADAWNALVDAFEDANPGIDIITEERATDPHVDLRVDTHRA